jgi:hypothetical protein
MSHNGKSGNDRINVRYKTEIELIIDKERPSFAPKFLISSEPIQIDDNGGGVDNDGGVDDDGGVGVGNDGGVDNYNNSGNGEKENNIPKIRRIAKKKRKQEEKEQVELNQPQKKKQALAEISKLGGLLEGLIKQNQEDREYKKLQKQNREEEKKREREEIKQQRAALFAMAQSFYYRNQQPMTPNQQLFGN